MANARYTPYHDPGSPWAWRAGPPEGAGWATADSGTLTTGYSSFTNSGFSEAGHWHASTGSSFWWEYSSPVNWTDSGYPKALPLAPRRLPDSRIPDALISRQWFSRTLDSTTGFGISYPMPVPFDTDHPDGYPAVRTPWGSSYLDRRFDTFTDNARDTATDADLHAYISLTVTPTVNPNNTSGRGTGNRSAWRRGLTSPELINTNFTTAGPRLTVTLTQALTTPEFYTITVTGTREDGTPDNRITGYSVDIPWGNYQWVTNPADHTLLLSLNKRRLTIDIGDGVTLTRIRRFTADLPPEYAKEYFLSDRQLDYVRDGDRKAIAVETGTLYSGHPLKEAATPWGVHGVWSFGTSKRRPPVHQIHRVDGANGGAAHQVATQSYNIRQVPPL